MAFVLLIFLSALNVASSSRCPSCEHASVMTLCSCMCRYLCCECHHWNELTGSSSPCDSDCDCSYCPTRQLPNRTHIEELLQQMEAKMHKNMSLPKTTKNLTELSRIASANSSLILP
mmetsp:Transcript_39571/g.70776  ORF Transcript_39571/g.70776 Transcript_39571/m.70776 type:complete len:117 (+) Transcript_39571:73-423(+)